jgi:oligoendopeptidase F
VPHLVRQREDGVERLVVIEQHVRVRAVLLQHAIDSIASTFYTQVMFADFELQAHRLVEQDQPVTADALNDIYARLLGDYYGDVIDVEPVSRLTWARIPHFFSTPYYVYQYATCFASTARLMQDIRATDRGRSAEAVERYLTLLRAGGSDYPMNLLARAGVDLSQPDTVRAVGEELTMLVGKLEQELAS